MDTSKYTQKMNMSQMQTDLPQAVINAEKLLYDFEMEAVEKLNHRVEGIVTQKARESEGRLNRTLAENCARDYRQVQETVVRDNRNAISALEAKMMRRQRQLERRLLIATISTIVLAVVMIALFILWFVIKH